MDRASNGTSSALGAERNRKSPLPSLSLRYRFSVRTTATKRTHDSFQQVCCWPVLFNRWSPPHVYTCAAPAMEGKKSNVSLWILPGSGSKWCRITLWPRHPPYRSNCPVNTAFMTFTLSSTLGRTTSPLECKTRRVNGGITMGCGVSVRLGAVMSKPWKISSTMGPVMLPSLFTAAVVADVGTCHFSFGRPLLFLSSADFPLSSLFSTTILGVIVGPCTLSSHVYIPPIPRPFYRVRASPAPCTPTPFLLAGANKYK